MITLTNLKIYVKLKKDQKNEKRKRKEPSKCT